MGPMRPATPGTASPPLAPPPAIHRAYRDPDNNDALERGSQIQHNRYDGLGRRIARLDTHGPRNIHKNYTYAGQSLVHVHHAGGTIPIRQMIWAGTFGVAYIDELIQLGMNDPFDTGFMQTIDAFFWPIHNANFNVKAIVDVDGLLVERYEYTPYGERQIYRSAGIHDPHAMSPHGASPRWVWTNLLGITFNHGLNPVGHQGLLHDGTGSATGGGASLVYNDARMRHVVLERFIQRDPLDQDGAGGGYHDGMNLYQMLRSNPLAFQDPAGTDVITLSSRALWYAFGAGHLSVEYWERRECVPRDPNEPDVGYQLQTDEFQARGYSRREEGWEVIARLCDAGHYPVLISSIERNVSGTDHRVVFNTRSGDVSDRWEIVSDNARNYEYGEYPIGGWANNYRRSRYEIPWPWRPNANNSRTFARTVVARSDMPVLEPTVRGHPGAREPQPRPHRPNRVWCAAQGQ